MGCAVVAFGILTICGLSVLSSVAVVGCDYFIARRNKSNAGLNSTGIFEASDPWSVTGSGVA